MGGYSPLVLRAQIYEDVLTGREVQYAIQKFLLCNMPLMARHNALSFQKIWGGLGPWPSWCIRSYFCSIRLFYHLCYISTRLFEADPHSQPLFLVSPTIPQWNIPLSFQVCDFLKKDNTTLVWDNEQQVPFAYKDDQWVGFDDERSLKMKVSTRDDQCKAWLPVIMISYRTN